MIVIPSWGSGGWGLGSGVGGRPPLHWIRFCFLRMLILCEVYSLFKRDINGKKLFFKKDKADVMCDNGVVIMSFLKEMPYEVLRVEIS